MQVLRIQMKTSAIAGELPGVMEHGEIAVNIPDHKLYVGVDSAPPIVFDGGGGGGGAFSINGATDFGDDTVATVTPTNQKGLMVRDASVAAGADGAWKLVSIIDAGTY